MNALITEYLESAARDVNNNNFRFESTNISQLVSEVISESKDRANQKNITLFNNLISNNKIVIDKKWMKIAVYNLISNAIKYSPSGKSIHVDTNIISDKYKISVKDEGPGISAEDQENLFKKFQRLSAKPTGNETATGLGLYIVKDIVEKHNGEVSCESSINRGSTFSIMLPLDS